VPPKGTAFVYTLAAAGHVVIAIERRVSVHATKRTHCVGRRHGTGKRARCTVLRTLLRISRSATSGANTTAFTGRTSHVTLKLGRYHAVLTATDAAGTAPTKTVAFTVVKARPRRRPGRSSAATVRQRIESHTTRRDARCATDAVETLTDLHLGAGPDEASAASEAACVLEDLTSPQDARRRVHSAARAAQLRQRPEAGEQLLVEARWKPQPP